MGIIWLGRNPQLPVMTEKSI
ncbi:hypothetical protein D299_gp007 [Escherichia phage HX01]|nr:hypothetical protein D299_gp007 [Escherichia phage HX01]